MGGLFGGSSATEPAQTNATAAQSDMAQSAGPCQMDIQNFRQCMDENQGSLNICGWYLDQLVSVLYLFLISADLRSTFNS